MSYKQKQLLEDRERKPIPQYYNKLLGQYEPQEGYEGGLIVHNAGTIVEDYWEGSEPITKTFPYDMRGFSIANDGIETLTFTINGITRTVYPGEPYNGVLKPFTQVTINASDKYRAEVLR